MIKVSYDDERDALLIAFTGDIDAAQVRRAFSDIERIMPRCAKGFRVVADFTRVDGTEPAAQGEILKAMDLFNAQGVTEVLRVLPDHDMDLGFNIMSNARYSRNVRVRNVRTLLEALASLDNEPREA